MVSTNTKMYNLRWALATPSVADDKNSKLYKYSGQQDTNNKLWGASSAEAAAERVGRVVGVWTKDIFG